MTVGTTNWEPLKKELRGDLIVSQGMRGAYATDASVYQEFPTAVALPRNADDVTAIVQFCRETKTSIIGRGGGTSLSGQAIGHGVVVDFSHYMNQIISIDPEQLLAVVQPGAVLDDLNKKLAAAGVHFPPDPATASRATIGGMIGNNACGTRSIIYGRTSDSIEAIDCLLADGARLNTTWLSAGEWNAKKQGNEREASIYSTVDRLVQSNRDLILSRIPPLPRVAAGYTLRPFIAESRLRSLSDLICGSEGTLALVTSATLRLKRLPNATVLVISAFRSVDEALVNLPFALECQPSAVELLDDVLIHEAMRNASTKEMAKSIVPSGEVPNAVLMVEFFGDSMAEAVASGLGYVRRIAQQSPRSEHRLMDQPAAQQAAWDVRRLALGLLSNLPGRAKAIALIEDACIPIDRLPEYNRFVSETGERLGLATSTYAHASVGVLHYKIMLDLHLESDRKKMREMAEACFEKCREVGGVFSGEHGDGIVRGEFLPKQFGPEIYDIFLGIKRLFDPTGILNPGRKIDSPPLDGPLRYGHSESERRTYSKETQQIKSWFRFGDQDGLVGAIEQCNGVGVCRQNLKGTMCPSYRATRDERDSTRGRANLLRLAISGQLDPPGLVNPELHAALDLCLACKACKSECPNAVDMARLKSEALQARWQAKGVSRQAAFIGRMPQRIARFHRWRWAARLLNMFSPGRWALEKLYGVDRRRALPVPARESFDQWWSSNRSGPNSRLRTVAMFVDTWCRYLEPEIGIGAVKLLRSCGYQVELVGAFDSLRTRLSVGMLKEAKDLGGTLFSELEEFAKRDVPIVCLEPSEASALRDDLPDLIEQHFSGVAKRVVLLDDFLAGEIASGTVQLVKSDPGEVREIVIHPHCHQRALFQPNATAIVLREAGFNANVSDFGCCGMAGSFGYSHFDVSKKIAEQRFLPGVRQAVNDNKLMVATGTSCRQQALDLGQIKLVHWLHLVQGKV